MPRPAPRVKRLAVMLYLLGLSYGAVCLVREGLGVSLCKSRGMMRCKRRPSECLASPEIRYLLEGKTPALGSDLTGVECKGEWLSLGITVDPISGLALTVDVLTAEDSKTPKEWIEPIAKSVDAQVFLTNDADGAEDGC